MKILIATNNKHKVYEIRQILGKYDIEVLSLDSVNTDFPEVIEDGTNFRENAIKKAKTISEYTRLPVLADDSGLEVFALNSTPGVYSARYAGENASDQENMNKLLDNMSKIEDRTARFVCSIAFICADQLHTVEGEIKGKITKKASGNGGFGYDPIFMPNGFNQTFADLSENDKNLISHRSNALKKALTKNIFGLKL